MSYGGVSAGTQSVIPFFSKLMVDVVFHAGPAEDAAALTMLDELARWADALKVLARLGARGKRAHGRDTERVSCRGTGRSGNSAAFSVSLNRLASYCARGIAETGEDSLRLELRATPADSSRKRPPGAWSCGSRPPWCSSVAQWQSIRLLTGGLLVRVQPEEPISFCKVSSLR